MTEVIQVVPLKKKLFVYSYIHIHTQKLRFISAIQFTAQPTNSCICAIQGTANCDEAARTRGQSRQETAWLKLAFPLEKALCITTPGELKASCSLSSEAEQSRGRNSVSQLAGTCEDSHRKRELFCKREERGSSDLIPRDPGVLHPDKQVVIAFLRGFFLKPAHFANAV